MKNLDKRTQNIILIVGVILIIALFVFLFIRKDKKEQAAPEVTPLISEEDHKLDAQKHPELADNEDWIEEVPNEEQLLYDLETNQSVSGNMSKVSYQPSPALTCQLMNGGVLTVGGNTSNTDAIYLNPEYANSSDTDSTQYGIYVTATDGNIRYAEVKRVGERQTADKCMVITDRTYDTLIPSSAGTYWKKNTDILTNAERGESITVRFRVIRFSDYTIVGTAKATITNENGEYVINNLVNTDVLATGEMQFEDRAKLISDAIAYIFSSSGGPTFSTVNEEYTDIMLTMATVEHCGKPYFSKLLNSSGDCITAGSISNCDLYAINIPYLGTGNITVYAAPKLQIQGFNVANTFFKEDINLTPFAYDFLYPFSKETLLVPESAYDKFYGK